MRLDAPGFWLMPSYGRVATRLPQFFAAAVKAGMSTPGYVVVDSRDYGENHEAYDALELPEGWAVWVVTGGGCSLATAEALAMLLAPDTEWVGWLADDLLPETPGWDAHVLAALTPYGLVSTNDALHAPVKFNGATAWGGDLVRAVGYITVPNAQHWYLDDLAEEIGRACGNWTCLMEVMVRHDHVSVGGERDGTTARTNEAWVRDDRAWHDWRRTDRAGVIERVLECMEANGVEMTRPRFDGLRIMIGSPCGDGRYESVFMRSYVETRDALRDLGAEVHFGEIPYVSDITAARNRLFGAFLRSGDDYLLWVDSDQGWATADAVRLLNARCDFAAAAGIRKVYPPSFAVHMMDDAGRPIPVRFDSGTGFLEASGVGFAFVAMSRACAERMVTAYADLAYDSPDGREEYGVFNPLIVNRSYKSEDMAFCWRWRHIGGRILIDPGISLKHVGAHVWEGAWLAELERVARLQAQAA